MIVSARKFGPAAFIRAGATVAGLGIAVFLTIVQARKQGVSVDLGIEPLLAAAGFLAISALLAGLRLKIIARRYGYRLSIGTALRANAAGAALAQIMITYIGHTSGRAMVLRKAGIRDADTIEFGILERLAALASLGTSAIAAAIYLFGNITFGTETAWIVGVYYVFGVGLSVAASSWIWRREIAAFVHSGNAYAFSRALIVATFWSVCVHAAMLCAFVALIVSFDHGSTALDIIAASLLIMFAAAVPISFGGWGVRELSAVTVLGYLEISSAQALSISIAIGMGALLVQLALWALSSASAVLVPKSIPQNSPSQRGLKLAVAVPAMMTVLVVFQLQVPIAGGVTNVNLADPFSFVGLLLFVAYWIERKSLPLWSQPSFNMALAAMSLVIFGGALHYWLAVGYSSWGIQNRLFGWLVLLAYLCCGALLANVLGEAGRRKAVYSCLASICSVSVLEILRYWLAFAGIAFPQDIYPLPGIGFSGNTNAQGLFILAGIALALALPLKRRISLTALIILFAAVYLTDSRAALVSSVLVTIVYMLVDRARGWIALPAAAAASFVFVAPIALQSFSQGQALDDVTASIAALQIIEQGADLERLRSIEGGLALWTESPFFGAGIGAHYEQTAASGTPLVIHNVPVWLLAETGGTGFLVFALVGILIARDLWRQWKSGSPVAGGILLFLIGAAAISMAHDLLYQRLIWFLLGLGCARMACCWSRGDEVK